MTTRWVLVTGAAVRLGREIALEFARAGWSVACHYHSSADAATALVQDILALGSGATAATVAGPLDSGDDAQRVFESAAAAAGQPLDCVVNNASTFLPDGAADFTSDGLLRQLRTNLEVPLVMGRLLHARADAAAANAGSTDRSLVQILDQKVFNLNPDYFSYTLSKLALERSVAQQAQALAPRVRVNAVAPGLLYPSGPQSTDNYEVAATANLLRRPTEPARVAQAVRFLAENPCITGASLCVDNGQHLVPIPRDIMFLVDELITRLQHRQP